VSLTNSPAPRFVDPFQILSATLGPERHGQKQNLTALYSVGFVVGPALGGTRLMRKLVDSTLSQAGLPDWREVFLAEKGDGRKH
jgi:hypothetical protein